MALGALLLRRDANRQRRAGTGRQTTKRAFAISIPLHGLLAGSAAATPGRGLKRNSDTLEAQAAAPEDLPVESAAEVPPMPNSEAAFRRANKLLRTPAGAVASPELEVLVRAAAARDCCLFACTACALPLHPR